MSETGTKSPLAMVHENGQPAVLPVRRANPVTSFSRAELSAILDVYGRKVAQGEWRDYALDFLKDRALFSVYRYHSERALHVIEKNPKLRQGPYLVTGQDGRILKRGHDLKKVLAILEPKLALVR